MTKPSPFSVRGRRALMVMRDEREIAIVRRQLNRLGMTISEHDPSQPPPEEIVDVAVIDADAIPIKSDLACAWRSGAADGAGQQHDADVSRLAVDGEVAVGAVARFPARDKGTVLGPLDALEIGG